MLLDDGRDRVDDPEEGKSPGEECRNTLLVGCVEHRGRSAASAAGSAGQAHSGKRVVVEGLEGPGDRGGPVTARRLCLALPDHAG